MAIRKSKEETFSVKGNTEEWLTKAEQALHKAEEAALHQHLCQQQSARNAAAYCKNVSRRKT